MRCGASSLLPDTNEGWSAPNHPLACCRKCGADLPALRRDRLHVLHYNLNATRRQFRKITESSDRFPNDQERLAVTQEVGVSFASASAASFSYASAISCSVLLVVRSVS